MAPFLLSRFARGGRDGWTSTSAVSATTSWAGSPSAGDLRALEELRVAALGKKGSVTELVKQLGELPAEQRRDAGQAFNALKREVEEAMAARRAVLQEAALDAQLAARADRHHPAGARAAGGAHPPGQPGRRGDRRDLRRHGLRGRGRPGRRGRLAQFRGAQHPARAPGPADVRHLLPRGRARRAAAAAAHAHQPGADPHHAGGQAAVPDHRARPHLPPRQRRHPHADVPSGRGPADRPAHAYGPPQGLPDRLRARLFRARRRAGALPARATSRSPSRRPRSTSAAAARATS